MHLTQDLQYQRQKNLQVIETLKQYDSDMSKPHLIEHHFNTFSKQCGQQLLSWGNRNGFQVTELFEGEHEGKQYWYFDLIKTTVPTIKNIFADTSKMLRLAAEFYCDYDGWGCIVVK